jgi:hypothetical protein
VQRSLMLRDNKCWTPSPTQVIAQDCESPARVSRRAGERVRVLRLLHARLRLSAPLASLIRSAPPTKMLKAHTRPHQLVPKSTTYSRGARCHKHAAIPHLADGVLRRQPPRVPRGLRHDVRVLPGQLPGSCLQGGVELLAGQGSVHYLQQPDGEFEGRGGCRMGWW